MDSYRAPGGPARKSFEELRERLLARAEKDRVGVRRGLLRQRRDVQAAEGDEAAAGAIAIRQAIGAIGVGDVDLDHHQVWRVVDPAKGLHVLVFDHRLIVGSR